MTVHDATIAPETPTADDLRAKRILAAQRLLLRAILTDDCAETQTRALYAMNLRGDLTEAERTTVLHLILDTFPPDIAEGLCRDWFEGAGYPGASLMESPVTDARFWAEGANSKEIDAYAMACFKRMSPTRRKQFLAWGNGEAVKPKEGGV